MNPFESARIEAVKLRKELELRNVKLDQGGLSLVTATCHALDVVLKQVRAGFPLLKGADATIDLERRWILIRDDVSDEVKAFLVAHELGHLRLHPAMPGTVEVSQTVLSVDVESNGAREVESYGARERQELQANVFAREFLLPREAARHAFLKNQLSASDLAEAFLLPLELVRLQLYDAVLLPSIVRPAKVFHLPDNPTDAQNPAVNSDAKVSLVEAGPGTGKTTTLLLRLRRLVTSGVAPENIIILTFSNKAARELVERARAGNIPGADRVWIGTFHAFGLEFLRKFGNLHGLDFNFPVLDKLASLAMLESDITNVDLEVFDPLTNPSPWLESAVDTIRRAKDEVFDAARFSASVTEISSGDPEVDAKRRDIAAIFTHYESLLSRRKAIDLTDLLCVPIRLMQSVDPAVEHFLAGIQHLMVDEYQDVNRASALLVKELSKAVRTLWVVGDANQAIYAFMGASSSNLEKFQVDFPEAVSIPLYVNHRSSQEIVDVFGKVASQNPTGRKTTSIKAEKGYLGFNPLHVSTVNKVDQLKRLARQIRTIEATGTPLAEQAVIVYKNTDAAEFASGLERLGVPVLYLGNIFERAEIKDLICLLQLAIDSGGTNLVRQWHSPLLALSRSGSDIVLAQTRDQDKSWREFGVDGLTSEDSQAWRNLKSLCALVTENMSPWEALSALLIEDGTWLRELASRPGQEAANALMAVWQFVHFCRSPDGTGRWYTVRNLPQRIRDRVRLGEDRSMRVVPPEAEGMNAVRILTAHGSKGLEFDAVHFLGVTKSVYEPQRPQSNKLLPDNVLDSKKALGVLRNERHNLLYVAVSRPRFHLNIYSTMDEELPSSLDGLLTPIRTEDLPSCGLSPSYVPGKPELTLVSLEEYLEFTKCPKRHEISRRVRKPQRDELKLHQAINIVTRKVMTAMVADGSLLADSAWLTVVSSELERLKLHEHSAAVIIRKRVEEHVDRGRNLLAQGGRSTKKVSIEIGPLRVALQPDQVFQDTVGQRLRFIRNNEKNFLDMKQPLAALLDAHHRSGGERMAIEVASLSNGKTHPVGTIQAKTRVKYEAIAVDLCAKHFPAQPSNERNCHYCSYMFPCSKRISE